MIEGLPPKSQQYLIDFLKTPYYEAYKEYVAMKAAQVFGQMRLEKDEKKWLGLQGALNGIECFLSDARMFMLGNDEEIKANTDNRNYTRKVMEKGIKGL